jgi:hypothetical protein
MAYIVRSPIPYKEGRKPLQPVQVDVRNLISRALKRCLYCKRPLVNGQCPTWDYWKPCIKAPAPVDKGV